MIERKRHGTDSRSWAVFFLAVEYPMMGRFML